MPGKRRWVFDKLCACFTLPSSGSNATSKHDNHPMSWFLVPEQLNKSENIGIDQWQD
jgi:hypothetical protein